MNGFAHVVFLIMTIIFPPIILIWILCACSASGARKKKDRELMERLTKALEEMARIEKWRGWRD